MQAMAKRWGAGLRATWGKIGGLCFGRRLAQTSGWVDRTLGGGEVRFDLDDYLEIPTYIRRGQAGIIRQGWLAR